MCNCRNKGGEKTDRRIPDCDVNITPNTRSTQTDHHIVVGEVHSTVILLHSDNCTQYTLTSALKEPFVTRKSK